MKKKTSSRSKQARTSVSRRRPIHKRVLLHPVTAFLLLCVGVLVAGSSFTSVAESYDVTAKVPAPALTAPASITQPTDQKHVSSSTVEVEGTCPDNSYVKLYRDSDFAGTAICSGGLFSIQTTLLLGANELLARVFNLTDDEGPASSLITVYYDLSVPVEAPPAPPTTLEVSNIGQDNYATDTIQEVVAHPTISGLAPPFSDVTVTFYSEPSVCQTKANARGVWTCTLPEALPPGLHHVVVTAVTPSGKHLSLPVFQIRVVEYAQPFVIDSDFHYKAYYRGQSATWRLAFLGGTPPYELVINWGDGGSSRVSRTDRSDFSISHTYDSFSLVDKNYAVIITATDARGATTVLQLAAAIKGSTILVNGQTSSLGALVNFVQHWLWVVWPAYIAVLLMTVSYWIGEKEAYQRFMDRRRMAHQRR